MLQAIKMALAPATASWAVQRYWAGKYEKALQTFLRAERWYPGLLEAEPTFMAYTGLVHFRLGHREESIRLLTTSKTRLDNHPDPKSSSEFIATLNAEIQTAINHLQPNP